MTLQNLRTIVEYNWNDELADYRQMYEESGEIPQGHIFQVLVAVSNFIDGCSETPESYLE